MCTSKKWVKTPYINHSILVPCGHCPSCQQQKANKRKARISDNAAYGEMTLFVTLTYDNRFIPYVKRSDLYKLEQFYDDPEAFSGFNLPVYRNYSGRYNRCGSSYNFKFVSKENQHIVTNVPIMREDYEKGIFGLSDIKKMRGCVSVILYSDLQNFFKRLYVNLSRKYGFNGKFSTFQCAEYGPTTLRSHFHLLFTIRPEDESLFRSAIIEAWPYADSRRTSMYIEIAYNASSYVASYVNRGSDFPPLLGHNAFKPRHSYSHGYGMGNEHYSLDSLQEKIRKGDMRYPVMSIVKGKFVEHNILVPKYVINRFFPLFKGYSRLPLSEVFVILKNPQRIANYSRILDLNQSDIHKIKVSLNNSFKRFCSYYSYDINDVRYRFKYAQLFVDAWKARHMTILRMWYDNEFNEPSLLRYDNWFEYRLHYVSPINRRYVESLLNESPELEIYDNPNSFPRNVSVTQVYSDLYFKKLKTRKVSNISMSSLGHDV